ncbi:universal stress protein [Marinobacterium jannaschii]|uniref:universal stress protein n=1 Tax=Marinobacterium jannaschii TaxID=64970 RepID=UPI00047F4197|nr:universal stress protein [Marinobacterium jannaschii]
MFKKVLVPIDLEEPEFASRSMELALREVQQSGAELHLMSVMPGYSSTLVASYFGESDRKAAVQDMAQKLKEFAAQRVPAGVPLVLKVYEGHPAQSILNRISKAGIDLVIMSAHHHSKIDEFLMGSTSARVVDRAKCSVLVLR